MKKKNYLVLFVSLMMLVSCNTHEDANIKTEADKQAADSISKLQQKIVSDSLKKRNALLIMPPDSNYSGEYTDKYKTGIIKFKGNFRFGKRHGQWMSFYPSGLAWSEMHYDKGLRQGPNLTYFENGKVRYKGYYKNDVKDSVWFYYDSLGQLSEKILFKNDRIVKKLGIK